MSTAEERVKDLHNDIFIRLRIWAGPSMHPGSHSHRSLAWHIYNPEDPLSRRSPCGFSPDETSPPKKARTIPNICRKCRTTADRHGWGDMVAAAVKANALIQELADDNLKARNHESRRKP